MTYIISHAQEIPALDCNWNASAWQSAQTAEIENFRPESSAHRPRTRVRLLHSANGLHGIFHVQDRFVRSVRTHYMDEVWKDSCVEFFVQPNGRGGYFNFEFNCGGAFLCCFITDETRVPGGFKNFIRIPESAAKNVKVRSTLPPKNDPEISEPIEWSLEFFIPFDFLREFSGDFSEVKGQQWRGNFFKCAEEISHPHWASWSPVDEFNFHLPRCFGNLQFA